MSRKDREQRAEYIVETYSDMLIRIGYTWFGNPYDAQDICQIVLMKCMECAKSFETNEQEKAWLLRVAINECKSLKRSAWFRRTVGFNDGVLSEVELPEDDGCDLFAQVQKLSPTYRQVIYLHYYEGYLVKEIASILGQSPNLVSTHLARAKAKLKNQLGGQENES